MIVREATQARPPLRGATTFHCVSRLHRHQQMLRRVPSLSKDISELAGKTSPSDGRAKSPTRGSRSASPAQLVHELATSHKNSLRRRSRLSRRTRRKLPSTPNHKLKTLEDAATFEEAARSRRKPSSCSPAALLQRAQRGAAQWLRCTLHEPSRFIKAVAFLCVLWIWVTTFGPQPIGLLVMPNGTLCPRATVCAEEWYTLLLLGISRTGAYFCYPFIMCSPRRSNPQGGPRPRVVFAVRSDGLRA